MARLLPRINRRQADAGQTPSGEPSLPAGVDPDAAPPTSPGFRERGQLRRRLRFLRKQRELQLRDLGGFVFDQHRFGAQRPELTTAKLERLDATATELTALEAALEQPHGPDVLREPGVGGACPACDAIHPSEARFCAQCGTDLRATPAPDEPAAPAAPTGPAGPDPAAPTTETAAVKTATPVAAEPQPVPDTGPGPGGRPA